MSSRSLELTEKASQLIKDRIEYSNVAQKFLEEREALDEKLKSRWRWGVLALAVLAIVASGANIAVLRKELAAVATILTGLASALTAYVNALKLEKSLVNTASAKRIYRSGRTTLEHLNARVLANRLRSADEVYVILHQVSLRFDTAADIAPTPPLKTSTQPVDEHQEPVAGDEPRRAWAEEVKRLDDQRDVLASATDTEG